MINPDNNWFVITGGPSSGKTTLLTELAKRGYRTMPEAARTLIDDATAKGISSQNFRANEKRFQEMTAQLKARFERQLPPRTVTFLDRGMHDTLAYLKYYQFPIEDWVTALLQGAHYKKVFILEPLDWYENDYARTEDEIFRRRIHDLLYEAYESYGMKPITVPPVDVTSRAMFIMERVKERAVL